MMRIAFDEIKQRPRALTDRVRMVFVEECA
jgi:hypothetical protein